LNELCKFPGESAKRYALQAKLQTLYLAITTSDADHTLTVQPENEGIQIDEVNTDQVNIVITEENDIEAEISNDQVHNAENTSRNFFVEKEAVLVQSQPKTMTSGL
jgi:hypothetical protein